jgi:hypothetical protein
LLEGFASKPAVVKQQPQKINVRRYIRRTKNIENTAPQTWRKQDTATGRHAPLGELILEPYKTRRRPNLVQVVF